MTVVISSPLARVEARNAETAVDMTADPDHHLAFENPYVRVFKVEVAPHATTLLHRHDHDYIFVVLGAAKITNAVEGKAPVTTVRRDGETTFVSGGFSHKVTNETGAPFRNVTVEILKPGKDNPVASASTRGVNVDHAAIVMSETLFVRDGVTAHDVTLNPGGSLPKHTHSKPHMVIAVSAMDLRSEAPGRPNAEVHEQPGDVRWVPAGTTHALTNIGKSPARFVSFDFE